MLVDGTFADYDRLIIATGARVRTLPGIRPRAGLLVLRGLDDAIALRRELMHAPRVAIVGAGFIGLEVAASCRARGLHVTVIESLPPRFLQAWGRRSARWLRPYTATTAWIFAPGLP